MWGLDLCNFQLFKLAKSSSDWYLSAICCHFGFNLLLVWHWCFLNFFSSFKYYSISNQFHFSFSDCVFKTFVWGFLYMVDSVWITCEVHFFSLEFHSSLVRSFTFMWKMFILVICADKVLTYKKWFTVYTDKFRKAWCGTS